MKKQNIGKIVGLATATAIWIGASASANADLLFNLNHDYSSDGLGAVGSIFGNVKLAQGSDSKTVDVTVTLFSPSKFVGTGSGYSLGFDLSGNPAISITGLSVPFTDTSTAGGKGDINKAGGTGKWEYFVDTTTTGASTSLPGPLIFSVHVASGGLTPASFVKNPNGHFFISDIIGPSGNTGDVTADAFVVVPEPTTLIAGALLLLPFGASAMRIRRRKA